MKKVRIGFAAIIALAAMSFTIASHSKVFEKRTDITNCYPTITTVNYLTCSLTPFFTALSCSNKASALGQAIKDDVNVGGFTTNTVTCSGTTNLCCINFKSTTTNPCTAASHLEKGGLTDFNNNAIPAGSWVLINDIECKD